MSNIDYFLAQVDQVLHESETVVEMALGKVDDKVREMAKEMLAQSHNSK